MIYFLEMLSQEISWRDTVELMGATLMVSQKMIRKDYCTKACADLFLLIQVQLSEKMIWLMVVLAFCADLLIIFLLKRSVES